MLSAKRIYQEFKSTNLLLSRRTLWALLILTLWMILKYFTFFLTSDWNNSIDINFSIIFVIACLVSASDVFAKLRGAVSGIHYLLTPASTEEKFISAWIYSTLYSFLIVFVLTSLVHMACILTGNAITGADIPLEIMSLRDLGYTFWAAMFVQSLFFLGSVVFRKNPVVKTVATLFLTAIVISFITSWILRGYIDWSSQNTFRFDSEGDWERIFNSSDPEVWIKNLKIIFRTIYYTLPFVCWTASYFALKHKQI